MLRLNAAKISGPDSDGDLRPEIELEFRNDGERPLELLSCRTYLFSGDGYIVATDNDDNDDYLESGDAWTGELSPGYIKENKLGSQAPRVQIEMLGCGCSHHHLKTFELKPELFTGINERLDMGDGISILSLSISVTPPDDDDDVTVELKALLENAGNLIFPRVTLAGKVMRSGREIEELSNYSDTIYPGQLTVLEASSYFKKRQLSGASVEVKLSLFPVLTREVVEATLEQE